MKILNKNKKIENIILHIEDKYKENYEKNIEDYKKNYSKKLEEDINLLERNKKGNPETVYIIKKTLDNCSEEEKIKIIEWLLKIEKDAWIEIMIGLHNSNIRYIKKIIKNKYKYYTIGKYMEYWRNQTI